jgi:hypothetical protein
MEDNWRQWSSMEDYCDWRPRCIRFVQSNGRKDMKRRQQVVTTLALISLALSLLKNVFGLGIG